MRRPPPTGDHPDTAELMRAIGLDPDPWQIELLNSEHPQVLLNCCRQAGKSTVVAMYCLIEAIHKPMTTVILLSRSHRQSRELLKLMHLFFQLLSKKVKARVNAQEMRLTNMSRIISLPCREDTIRGYAQVDLLVIDEAARVPDDLYRTVRPMLAVSKGRLICLSTPNGKRGFFWNAWAKGGDDWLRIEVPASKIPRITPEFLELEKRSLGESWYRQEYCCSFEAMEGLVYPDFARCVVRALPAGDTTGLQKVGGIDFGFRNPFAAVWGFIDRDDNLWLTGEHYMAQRPVSYHAQHLPRDVMWYADPSGATDIAELQRAGLKVRKGNNALRQGIAAVSARLQDESLFVLEGRCPNLLIEASLYCYGDAPGENNSENPLDKNNHALAALRYMLSRTDARRKVKPAESAPPPPRPRETDWNDDRYWIPLNF